MKWKIVHCLDMITSSRPDVQMIGLHGIGSIIFRRYAQLQIGATIIFLAIVYRYFFHQTLSHLESNKFSLFHLLVALNWHLKNNTTEKEPSHPTIKSVFTSIFSPVNVLNNVKINYQKFTNQIFFFKYFSNESCPVDVLQFNNL